MSAHLIPRRDLELVPWLTQFGPKFAQYAPTLGFSAQEVEQTQREIDYLIHLLNVHVPALRRTLNAAVEFKNFIKDGDPSAIVPAWVLTRLKKLVLNIKTRPGYTKTIGRDLDIVREGAGSYPEVPTLTLTNASAGAVTVGWNKGDWTGVKLQTRQNGVWVDLGIDLQSPFIDTRPLATPYQPEGREYRACYFEGDTVEAVFSPVLEVIVAP